MLSHKKLKVTNYYEHTIICCTYNNMLICSLHYMLYGLIPAALLSQTPRLDHNINRVLGSFSVLLSDYCPLVVQSDYCELEQNIALTLIIE